MGFKRSKQSWHGHADHLDTRSANLNAVSSVSSQKGVSVALPVGPQKRPCVQAAVILASFSLLLPHAALMPITKASS